MNDEGEANRRKAAGTEWQLLPQSSRARVSSSCEVIAVNCQLQNVVTSHHSLCFFLVVRAT